MSIIELRSLRAENEELQKLVDSMAEALKKCEYSVSTGHDGITEIYSFDETYIREALALYKEFKKKEK